MPTFTIEAPNGKSYDIDGPNAEGALAALKKHLGTTTTAAPEKPQPSIIDAVTDIPSEIANAAGEGWQNIKGIASRGEKQGPIEGLMTVPKAVMGVGQVLLSPATGAARSVGGHLMAEGERLVGENIVNPIVERLGGQAQHPDPQKMYETAKGDVDLALTAARPAGVPIKVAGPASTSVAPSGATITTATRPAYEWQAPPAKTVQPSPPTIPELKAAASANYESPALTGLEVKPVAISDFASRTKVALDAGGIDENLAPKTHAILSKLEKVPDDASAVVTGNNIKSLRQLLGNAAGEPGKEGLAASRALKALDEHIPAIEKKDVIAGNPKAAGEALDTANADYSAAKHAETIDNKTIRAELRAAASNSGHNVANTIRQRMADILNPERPDLQRGFQPDELAMMDRIVRGTRIQNAMRWAGNYLGGGGGLGALHTSGIGAGVGAAIAGPIGAAVGAVAPPALGYILKAIGNRGTLADAAKLSEMIRSRAPLASSAQKFHQAATQLTDIPSGKTYAAALIAARNLSTNLRGAGVDVSPADLLRGLQSPSQGNAQEHNDVPRPPGQ